ncbi:MAG: hypothetical protein ETSY2_17440 [Candidatus Entotheonella gemina]|uniref:HAMP domain-containing protein n=1 Tax=Candidatus Entotheonella gemina TaxID=1429439 RepID=W4M8Z1_9BACT|nr:MAG: hypothetical protein ETSY2_17440 [Candidatus Entotheonella gemina]
MVAIDDTPALQGFMTLQQTIKKMQYDSIEETRVIIRKVRLVVFTALGVITLLMLTLMVMAYRIVSPLPSLSSVAEKLAAGDIGQRIDYVSRDEIGVLANALRAMAQAHQDKVEIIHLMAQGLSAPDIPTVSERDALGHALRSLQARWRTLPNTSETPH